MLGFNSDISIELKKEPTRAPLSQALFKNVRSRTRDLIQGLSDEDLLLSVTEETSPAKWHLAHTTWFFEEFVLKQFVKSYVVFDPTFSFLFNSYYQSLGEFLPKSKRAFLSRPSVSEILQYRKHVETHLLAIDDWSEFSSLIELGLNHEQQHQELLLMDMKRNFFENPTAPAFSGAKKSVRESSVTEFTDFKNKEWKSFAGGLITVGVPFTETKFTYDNERDAHQVWLDPFSICTTLVSNRDYLDFMEDKGYLRPEFWLSDGWDWVQREKINAPLYWKSSRTAFTLYGELNLDLDAPVVHLSYYEADAYAKYRNARLPTEQEWEHAARSSEIHGSAGFYEDGQLQPVETKSMHGSVWQWTRSAYLPYPRYVPTTGGLAEYNEKFMCNQFVLRGGSCVTSQSHYRLTYRNFFYPHQRWMFAGVRLAKDHQSI